MTTRDAPGALHALMPYLMLRDVARGIACWAAALDAAVARAVQHGAEIVHPIADRDDGRSGAVRDPSGILWHITSQRAP